MDVKKDFTKLFLEFYVEFLSKTADAIKKLANIQRNFSDEYELYKEVQVNPLKFTEFIDKLDEKKRAVLLEMFIRINTLQNRLANVFNLTPEEQEKLSTDLKDFADIYTNKIIKLDD